MTNLAKEARDKAQATWPGAAVHSRGPNWIQHQHPSNLARFILDTHIGPIHYGANEEIDTAWQPTTGAWQYEMTLNSFQTYARDTFNVGDIFQFEKGGHTLAFDPQSINWVDENNSRQQIAIKQAVAGIVDGDVLRFPAAYGPGRHFQYQNQTARLQKLITIDALTDLPPATVQGNDIWFEAEFSLATSAGINFWLDGVEWARSNGVRVQTADRIEIRNSAGDTVLWWLGAARAWDSSGDNETAGQLEVRRRGGPSSLFITVRIPQTWIDAATFPIYIDPTIDEDITAGNDDAHENNAGSMNIGDTFLNVREFAERYAGVRFQTVAVPNAATIDVAYLTIGTHDRDDPECTISAEDTNAPAVYTTTTSDITSRTYTTANTNWSGLNIGAFSSQNTPSLVTAVQEVVDLGAWASGDDMAFMLSYNTGGNLNFYAYEHSTGVAAKLHIEYTAGGDFSVNVSDSVTIGESVTVTLPDALAQSVSESVTIAESATVALQIAVNVSDSVTIAESVSVAIVDALNVSVSDAVTIGESNAAAISDLIVNVSDGLTIGEAVAVTLGAVGDLSVSVADALTIGEAVTLQLISSVSVSDSVTIGEAQTVIIPDALNIAAADSVTIAEAVTLDAVRSIAVSDGLTIGESTTLIMSDLQVSTSDGATIGEAVNISISTVGALDISVSDGVTIAESVTLAISTLVVSTSDSITIGESVNASIVAAGEISVNVSDSVTIGEVVTIDNTRAVSVAEAITIAESVSLELTRTLAVSDSVTIAESVTIDNTRTLSVSDSVTIAESVSASISDLALSVVDSLTIGESVTAVLPDALALAVADSVTIAESVAALVSAEGVLNLSVSDGITIGESLSVALPDALQVAVSDGLTVGETANVALVAVGTLTISVVESVTIGDSTNVTISTMAVSVAEAVTIGESVTVARIEATSLSVTITDALTISEAVSIAPLLLSDISVSDAVTIVDSPFVSVAGTVFFINVSDGVTIADAVTMAIFGIVPLERIFAIGVDNRIYPIGYDHRVYDVEYEDRTYPIILGD